MSPEELFSDINPDLDIDGLDIVNIDLDKINDDSIKGAKELIENLSKFYYDEEFMKDHPEFKKRIDVELESLRVLLKMRHADEETHDILIKAIAGNSNNASLYRALTEIQKTILSIITKMEDVIINLNNMMKGFQLELPFKDYNEGEEENQQETETENITAHRGSKEFILSIQKQTDSENMDDLQKKED